MSPGGWLTARDRVEVEGYKFTEDECIVLEEMRLCASDEDRENGRFVEITDGEEEEDYDWDMDSEESEMEGGRMCGDESDVSDGASAANCREDNYW